MEFVIKCRKYILERRKRKERKKEEKKERENLYTQNLGTFRHFSALFRILYFCTILRQKRKKKKKKKIEFFTK